MRKIAQPLDALFPKTRQAVLGAVLGDSGKWWYQNDLARHLGTPPSSLQRELAQLFAAGILLARKEGNRVYFKVDAKSPIYPELKRLLEKTRGIVAVLRETVAHSADQITVAFVFGSVARGEERADSDVDFIVVGSVAPTDIYSKLRSAESRLGRPISALVYAPEEFARKLDADNHFLTSVLHTEKLFVIGTEHDLDAITSRRHRPDARRDQGRA